MERINMMQKRQFGLNNQMKILERNPKVYDSRIVKDLYRLKQEDYSPELWFIEGTDKKDYPFMENSEKSLIVSAYFAPGHFHYSCMGERDSDAQYIAIATNLENVDLLAEAVLEKGGEKIIIGTIVNPRKTIDFALNNQRNLEQKVRDIMALPKEGQEKAIKELLEYRTGEN